MAFWCKGKKDYCDDSSCEACNTCKYENGSGGIELEGDDVKDIFLGQWISVKDRLPEHGKIVFCHTAYFYEVLQWDDDAEQWVGQFGIHGKRYVTHWMPLPEPPKEE